MYVFLPFKWYDGVQSCDVKLTNLTFFFLGLPYWIHSFILRGQLMRYLLLFSIHFPKLLAMTLLCEPKFKMGPQYLDADPFQLLFSLSLRTVGIFDWYPFKNSKSTFFNLSKKLWHFELSLHQNTQYICFPLPMLHWCR